MSKVQFSSVFCTLQPDSSFVNNLRNSNDKLDLNHQKNENLSALFSFIYFRHSNCFFCLEALAGCILKSHWSRFSLLRYKFGSFCRCWRRVDSVSHFILLFLTIAEISLVFSVTEISIFTENYRENPIFKEWLIKGILTPRV